MHGDQSAGGFVHIDEDNDLEYLGEVRHFGQAPMPAWIDQPRNQAIIMCEGDVSGLIVLAVDLDDNTQINWRTVIGGTIIGSTGVTHYDAIYTSYTFPIVRDSGGDIAAELIDMRDGSIIDSGVFDMDGDDGTGQFHSYFWDELRNSLYVSTNDDDAPVVRLTFSELSPEAADVDAPTGEFEPAAILRASDIEAVVDVCAADLQTRLSKYADLSGGDYLNINLDLNGYSFINLASASNHPNEVERL